MEAWTAGARRSSWSTAAQSSVEAAEVAERTSSVEKSLLWFLSYSAAPSVELVLEEVQFAVVACNSPLSGSYCVG